jgi:hypothetical protein
MGNSVFMGVGAMMIIIAPGHLNAGLGTMRVAAATEGFWRRL